VFSRKVWYKPTLRKKETLGGMLPFHHGGQSISPWRNGYLFPNAEYDGKIAREQKAMTTRIRPIRANHGLLAVAACVSLAASAAGQLRDSFEGADLTWQVSKESDCGVRILEHDRPYRDAHSGQASERFRLAVGQGTFLPLVHSIGRSPVIKEFRPRLFVKADRPSLQLMARVVFPRNVDKGSGQPITSLLRGDIYTDVGQWQQLAIRDAYRLLEQETRQLRTQFGSEIDPREAFVDLIVLNAYSAPGNVELWIDDLEIDGYVNLDSGVGPQMDRHVAGTGSGVGGTGLGTSAATVSGSLIMVRGRPFVPRVVQFRGEPFDWLKSLGFNTIKLSSSPSAAELKEAQRLDLWLIAPPPYGDQPAPEADYERVIAWSVGTRLSNRDLLGTRELATEVRAIDPQRDRPLIAGADAAISQYSRLANLLLFERPSLGNSRELADERKWLLGRSRLARPGIPELSAIETQRTSLLNEQLLLLSRGAPVDEDIDPEQVRLETFHAISAGMRGFFFPSEHPLAIDTASRALRTDAIRLVNMELKLLEPWIAGGQMAEEMAAPDGSLQVSTLTTDRSRLLILTQHAAAQQFVLGPPPRNSVSVVVPGVSASDRAYVVSLAGVQPIHLTHSSSGSRIVLEDAPHAAAIVVTQDHLAMHHLYRTLEEIKKEDGVRLKYDVTARRLVHAVEIDRKLTELGHPLAAASSSIQEAQANLQQASRLLETNDLQRCYELTTKAERAIARIRRGHWEQTARAFPTPAASPCIAQFSTLPLHWTIADRIRKGQWGGNVQAAGDMESLDQMLKAGWQQQRLTAEEISADVATDVTLSLTDPHSGRSALRLQAWAIDTRKAPHELERPPIWVTSSPVPVRQGQIVRIHGFVNVPKQLGASTDGLLIFNSLSGSDLGDRIRLTQGWRAFTLYRAVPQNGDLTVTFALTGLGEASIDDLAVSILEPEPIRPR